MYYVDGLVYSGVEISEMDVRLQILRNTCIRKL